MSIKVRTTLNKALVIGITGKCSQRGSKMALDHLASESKKQVPLDQGPLKDSCKITVNSDGSAGAVSYDTAYAVIPHERRDFAHQRGRKAKYLEDPANSKSVLKEMHALSARGFKEQMG